MSKFRGVKTNNAKTTAKIDIRQSIFDGINGDKSVLEVFCGAGDMYQAVWKKAGLYTGIDKDKFFDNRHTICGDARKALKLIDLRCYNIFDIDAYGSPYEVLSDIIPLIGGHKQVGFALTDGTNMDLKMGRISSGMRKFTGMDFQIAKRAHIMHDSFISDVINSVAVSLRGDAGSIRIAKGVKGSAMRYYSFIITRDID